jgi:transposase
MRWPPWTWGRFVARYRADGHGQAAYDPEMMITLLLYAYCQGERSSRVIEQRCVRDVAYRVIVGGLYPDHATIARFRARHEQALGELFSQVLRLLAAEGMVSLGKLSLDGTKLAGKAAHAANRTLPQIEKLLAEAAETDAAEDAQFGDEVGPATPQALARRAERRQRLARARDRLAAEDKARCEAQRAKVQAWEAAAATGARRSGQRPGDEPRANRAGTAPLANLTDPDVRIIRSKKGYVSGYNGRLVVTEQQVIVGAMLSQHPVDRTLLHPVLDACRQQLTEVGMDHGCAPCTPKPATPVKRNFLRGEQRKLRLLVTLRKDPNLQPNQRPRKRAQTTLPATVRADRRMRHHRGKADYKLRGQTVEPVVGQIKSCQKLTTMSRRGIAACSSEWLLIATAHNLRKLHMNRRSHGPRERRRKPITRIRAAGPLNCRPTAECLCDRLMYARAKSAGMCSLMPLVVRAFADGRAF